MLLLILVICFIAIISVALTFFYSKNVSKYGNRLDDIDKYPIKDKYKDKYTEFLKENENVKNVTFNNEGRVIYVHIDFNDSISLDDAKALVNSSLEQIDESLISYYDFNFVLESKNFTILGAKNSTIDHISWNNNTEVTEEETTDEEA